MIQARIILLLMAVYMSSAASQQATDFLTLPILVLKGSDNNICPPIDVRQEARRNLSAAVRDAISGSFYNLPQCGPGRWRQVIDIDMSDPTQQCPSPWEEYSSPARSCGRPLSTQPSCSQVSFPVTSSYSRVCGRLIGLAVSSVDAFLPFGPRDDENYLDGISLTHSSPRQHIWSFAADDHITGPIHCPCSGSPSSASPPSFVGDNYFCDSGANGAVWDGEGCVQDLSCCNFNSPPWFSVQLPQATSDAVDARTCADEGTNSENVLIQEIEIYVQ